MFKLARIFARIKYNGTAPEHNPSVLDYMPKGGQVGYTTNNPQLAFLLLSEPAERFNFHIKDFSRFDNDFEQKVVAAGANHHDLDFNNMYGRRNINGGDVFDCDTVFTHQFPKNVEEAKKLEQVDGGVNLFMHIEFDNSAGENWDEDKNTRMLECKNCGKIVRVTPELIEAQTNASEMTKDIEIGDKTNCNLTSALCDWQDKSLERFDAQNTQSGEKDSEGQSNDLHSYFDERGLFVKFKVDKNMELNKARVELLRNIAGGFKL